MKINKLRIRYFTGGVLVFCIFILLSFFVSRDIFTQIDFDLTVKIQDNIPKRIDSFFSSFSLLGSFELTTLIFLGFLLINSIGKRKWHRVLLFSFFILFHVVEILGKTIIEHHGPPFMFHRYTYGFHFPSTYITSDYFSYPSGHVGRMFLLGGLIVLTTLKSSLVHWKKYCIISSVILLAGIMLVSRIYLGEHWTTDTIGGALLGLSFAFFSMVFW